MTHSADAEIIPLDVWKDPQGDIILVYSEHECSIYFNCWIAPATPAEFIAQLVFSRARSVRSFHREYQPYRIPTHNCRSFILRIPDSNLIPEHVAYRQRHYPEFPDSGPPPNHYVVRGHDIYHEIVADSFSTVTISKQDLDDPRLVRLYREE